MKNVQKIYGVFLFLIALHYFYSYLTISLLLRHLQLSTLPIISFDDISFSFGVYNYQIVVILLLSNTLLFLWHLLFPGEKDLKTSIESTKKDLSLLISPPIKLAVKKTYVKIIFAIICLIVIVLVVYWFYKLDGISRFSLMIALIVPFLYIFLTTVQKVSRSQKNLLAYALIFLNIVLGIFIISHDAKNAPLPTGSTRPISFEWKGKTVSSNKKYFLYYAGYKYIAMRNDSLHATDLYPVTEISRIVYSDK